MVKSPPIAAEITLRVSESAGKDVGRGIARIDPSDMQRLGVDVDDVLEVEGKRRTVCRVLPTFKEHRGKEHLQIDGVIRENARVGLGEAWWGDLLDARVDVETVNADLFTIARHIDGRKRACETGTMGMGDCGLTWVAPAGEAREDAHDAA